MNSPQKEGHDVAFSSVVVGLDTSDASLDAARQVAAIAGPQAQIWGVSCWDPGTAMHAGIHAGAVARELREQSVAALEEASEALPPFEPILIRGSEVAGLLSVAENNEADLIAVGASGIHGAIGVLTGSTAQAICRHAPCSVLVSRSHPEASARGPVIVASDGSVGAQIAVATAARIASREELPLIVACAGGESGCDDALAAAETLGASGRALAGEAPGAITELAETEDASLIVVGARGRRGLRGLGSVSRRIADRAPCSTLIVRPRSYPTRDALKPNESAP